ncbi:MAG: Amino acid/amide ABC transporter ATP-binding protein 2 [Parcubacteria bacterium 34_609]|nr:MAG: Amino acid/amide ABC transporter ATP-binding protein 2 [Parcubacteria bacterium 34_609]
MFEVIKLNIFRGEIHVLWDVSLNVEEGEIVAVIGANGSGKSTLIETILGLLIPKSGNIKFFNKEISNQPSYEIARMGIAWVPEGRRIFKNMSVYENLEIGSYPRRARVNFAKNIKWIYELFPILKTRANKSAGLLSGGEQQMLAIGRALMLEPKLLLVDELSLGLAPKITQEVFEVIKELRRRKITVLLVEQNVDLALKNSDRCYILETGKVTLSGKSSELIKNKEIRKAYLGL